jgi:hypothetical protein
MPFSDRYSGAESAVFEHFEPAFEPSSGSVATFSTASLILGNRAYNTFILGNSGAEDTKKVSGVCENPGLFSLSCLNRLALVHYFFLIVVVIVVLIEEIVIVVISSISYTTQISSSATNTSTSSAVAGPGTTKNVNIITRLLRDPT